MPKNESEFKVEFRKALRDRHGDNISIWTNNDMFNVGLPDFSVYSVDGFFPIEAKFAKKLPKRNTSKVLTHELTEAQYTYLNKIHTIGGRGHPTVLIGFPDTAIGVPFRYWPQGKLNITVDELLMLRSAYEFPKLHSGWDVAYFLGKMVRPT